MIDAHPAAANLSAALNDAADALSEFSAAYTAPAVGSLSPRIQEAMESINRVLADV